LALQKYTAMDDTVEMDKLPDNPIAREIRGAPDRKQRDEKNLARLGKRGVLKVNSSSLKLRFCNYTKDLDANSFFVVK
jgi:hypothetical protein